MGKPISLIAADSHKLGGYRAEPAGKPKGGIVVVQEIFGVNKHIRDVCDRFAAEGYLAVAPAVFDRLTTPGFECGYTPDEVAHARSFLGKLDWQGMMADITVFDPATVRDRSTFEQPHQYPAGIPYVIVNGVAVVDGGVFTDRRPGRVIRKPR